MRVPHRHQPRRRRVATRLDLCAPPADMRGKIATPRRTDRMSDDTNTPPEAPDTETATDFAEAAQPSGDPTELLLQENAELKDRMLRIAAEMENLRKRTEREIS